MDAAALRRDNDLVDMVTRLELVALGPPIHPHHVRGPDLTLPGARCW